MGVAICRSCTYFAKHRLHWPADGYYQVSTLGRTLWAWDRDCLLRLRTLSASTSRELPRHWMSRVFIKYVPSEFLTAKHRGRVVRAIDRLIREPVLPNPSLQRIRYARR